MVLSILQGRLPRSLYLWWDFCRWDWFRKVFLFTWGAVFLFLSLLFFHGVRFHYNQVLVIFLLSKSSDDFPICFRCFPPFVSLFPFFIINKVHFSITNSFAMIIIRNSSSCSSSITSENKYEIETTSPFNLKVPIKVFKCQVILRKRKEKCKEKTKEKHYSVIKKERE